MSRDILLNLIDSDPDQPRKQFDQVKLGELTQSIAANGLIVPILVRPAGERFIIVHGERRWRAATALGWETIPAEVREIEPDQAGWLALVENVQRSDLTPIEEAVSYKSRLDEGLTQAALGQRIGKSQSYIAQKLRLLKLPDEVRESINQGNLSEGHGRQLLRLNNAQNQLFGWRLTVENDLSVAGLKEYIDLFVDFDQSIEQLKADGTAIMDNLLHVQSLLTPELYSAWLTSEVDLISPEFVNIMTDLQPEYPWEEMGRIKFEGLAQ